LWKTGAPSKKAMECATLKEFYREDGYTAPFVSLGTSKARRECVTALSASNCIVVTGPEGCGKTWLVRRSLRDAISFGYRIQYVSVASLGSTADFIDLLKAIREGDPQQQNSHIHEALPREPFADFYELIKADPDTAKKSTDEIKRACETFERGLAEAARAEPVTIVLDQFSMGKSPKVSFSKAEFTKEGVRDLWKRIATGQVKDVRILLAARTERCGRIQ
jgi:hypothetical protein